MLKFWMMYWFSSLYYSYLSLYRGQKKASEFLEHFAFIMQMKDTVKFQLSMRKLAQIYNYVEPRLLDQGKDLEDSYHYD